MYAEISANFVFLKPAPAHICEVLNLRKKTFWIMCLAETIDLHKLSKAIKQKVQRLMNYFFKKVLWLDNDLK